MGSVYMSSEEQLRHLRQLEAIGRLSGAVAHDINNQLSSILGYSQLLLCEPGVEPLKSQIEEISNAGKRIASLALILLAFNRRNTYYPEILDLDSVIREMERFIPHIVGPGISFVTVKESGLKRIRADSSRIKQALMTLALDVRDIMPGGGTLILSTKNIRVTGGAIWGNPHIPGRYVLITAEAAGNIEASRVQACSSDASSAPIGSSEGMVPEALSLRQIIALCGGQMFMSRQTEEKMVLRIFLPAAEDAP